MMSIDRSRAAAPGTALLALHLAVALFGFAGLFGKWIPWDPVAIVLGRTSVASLVLAALALARDGRIAPLSWSVVPNGALLAVHWIAFFAAIQASTVAVGLLGFASFPLFTPLVERVLLRTPLTARALRGGALVAIGLLLVVPEFSWASATVRGLAWGVLSGFTFALLAVRTRQLRVSRRAADIALWQNAIAALCVAPWVVMHGTGGPLTWQAFAAVALLGVACTALAHTLFAVSLAHVRAATAAVVAALEPVYGIALAALLQDEWPTARVLAGVAVLVTVAVLASRRARTVEPV
ncbi:MAG: DMT family transporter [Burkholderiales bacterium]